MGVIASRKRSKKNNRTKKKMKLGSFELNNVYCVDCLGGLKQLPNDSVDSVVTDPPYELGFMGKKWDSSGIACNVELWKEVLRVLKPGGFLLSFGGTRTYHRMTCAIEDAGFEIRDTIMWLYASGFPKSLNIGKQIDKLNGKRQEEFIALGKYLREKRGDIPQSHISKHFPSKTGGLTGCVSNWEKGTNVPTKEQWNILKRELQLDDDFDYIIEREEAEREVTGKDGRGELKPDMFFSQDNKRAFETGKSIGYGKWDRKDNPSTVEAKLWDGWGTALKPAVEPVVVARKPLGEKNVALNVLKWGVGGINIDECRIGTDELTGRNNKNTPSLLKKGFEGKPQVITPNSLGRFPANIILDTEAGELLDEQSGILKSGDIKSSYVVKAQIPLTMGGKVYEHNMKDRKGSTCGASRYFYCAKSSKAERGKDNTHPTVKPVKLMQYLVRLVTPKNGVVLDPFGGSGTTGLACFNEGMNYLLFEREVGYVKICEKRLAQSNLNSFNKE